MSDLKDYGDREIALLMKESIKRMSKAHALTRSSIRDLYDEYRSRSDDARDNPIEPYRPYRGSGK